jgi:hypothetical protein
LVYDVVSRLPANLAALAHQGPKAYGSSFDLIYRREAGRSNAIWQFSTPITPGNRIDFQSSCGHDLSAYRYLDRFQMMFCHSISGTFGAITQINFQSHSYEWLDGVPCFGL